MDDNYTDKCRKKINYHKAQLTNAKAWDNSLSIIIVMLSTIQTFTMTIMLTFGSNSAELAIVSGAFSVLVVLFSRIKESYQFLSLHYQHSHVCEEFTDLHYAFLNDSDPEKNIIKYSVVLNKSHLQHINNCRSLFCCISKYSEELL